MPYITEDDGRDVFVAEGDRLEIAATDDTGVRAFPLPVLGTICETSVIAYDDEFPSGTSRWLIQLDRLKNFQRHQYGYVLASFDVILERTLLKGEWAFVDLRFVQPRLDLSPGRRTYLESELDEMPGFAALIRLMDPVPVPESRFPTPTEVRATLRQRRAAAWGRSK